MLAHICVSDCLSLQVLSCSNRMQSCRRQVLCGSTLPAGGDAVTPSLLHRLDGMSDGRYSMAGSLTTSLPVDTIWAVLTDYERLPEARLA